MYSVRARASGLYTTARNLHRSSSVHVEGQLNELVVAVLRERADADVQVAALSRGCSNNSERSLFARQPRRSLARKELMRPSAMSWPREMRLA